MDGEGRRVAGIWVVCDVRLSIWSLAKCFIFRCFCVWTVSHLLVPQIPAVLWGVQWEALSAALRCNSSRTRRTARRAWVGCEGGWVINSWSQIPPSAPSLQRGLFSASLSSEEIRYFTLAFVSVPTKDLQTSSSEAERDLSLREHVKGIIINVRKQKTSSLLKCQ